MLGTFPGHAASCVRVQHQHRVSLEHIYAAMWRVSSPPVHFLPMHAAQGRARHDPIAMTPQPFRFGAEARGYPLTDSLPARPSLYAFVTAMPPE